MWKKGDIPSFLETAEDLNIRGLSEANTESLILKSEFPSEPTHKEIIDNVWTSSVIPFWNNKLQLI